MKANINKLAEGSTSTGDVLHLHPKLLDHLDYRCHHVASVHVQDYDWDDAIWSRCDVLFQHCFDPRAHHRLVHPCGWLTMVEVVRRVNAGGKLLLHNAAIRLPLVNEHQQEQSAVGTDCYHHGHPLRVVQ